MANMESKRKKIMYKKKMRLLAAAALTTVLISGQVQGVYAQQDTAVEETDSIFPENITIEEPMALSDISLPENKYGTLSWADSSLVPSERVQSYEVVLEPYAEVDLSQYDGWDEENGVLLGTVTVVVSSISEPEFPEEPEISGEPSLTVTPGVSEMPDISELPDITEVPEENQGDPGETENPEEDMEAGSAEIGADTGITPTVTEAPTENIFDQPDEVLDQDSRPVDVEENLSEEEMFARAAENHSCNGISVSGISLPWYVQFRVSSGDEYEFSNESDASIFKSYEFELWDLRTDTEYTIPDGEYISVVVPVKEGYDYTIEHLLDNGAVETIIPSVEGDTMIFSTHSFSPFGIAGSKPLVGGDIAEEGYSDDGEKTTEVSLSPAASSDTATTSGSNQITSQNTKETDASSADTETQNQSSNSGVVETGDSTVIAPFIILAVVAVVLIAGAVVFIKKRK